MSGPSTPLKETVTRFYPVCASGAAFTAGLCLTEAEHVPLEIREFSPSQQSNDIEPAQAVVEWYRSDV